MDNRNEELFGPCQRAMHRRFNPVTVMGSASSSAAVQSPRDEACPSLTPSIWEKLPDDLLETVFTKLPISALNKFSQLSKRWRAFIHSEEFAHRCHSRQLTAVYFDADADSTDVMSAYTAVPSPKTRLENPDFGLRWENDFLEFISEDEMVDHLFAADQGLLCYRVRKWPSGQFEEIVLVVHNLLTQKWRRLVVPYTPETKTRMESIMDEEKMLVGLCVDEETGSYKLVVAFLDSDLTRKTFVYNSPSASWTISAAVFPGLEQREEYSDRKISRSICCAGEVYWLVENQDQDDMLFHIQAHYHHKYPHFKTLIKYSMKLDTWSVATQQRPCEEGCHLHLASLENQLVLVNFDDVSEKKILFPDEFSSLVPGFVKFDAKALGDVMNKTFSSESDQDYFESTGYKPVKAAIEGSALFIYSELTCFRKFEVIFGFNTDSPEVIELPSLNLDSPGSLYYFLDATVAPFLFTSTLKAFV